MAVTITGNDFLNLYFSYNKMLLGIAALVAEAAMSGYDMVDSQMLLEICQKHSSELIKVANHTLEDKL